MLKEKKTADLGREKFLNKKGYICLSWSGGASSVSKADWSLLENRKVLIWGDNDKPGRKAQADICKELNKLDHVAVRAIDHNILEKNKFPEKWDLADPMPEGFSRITINSIAKESDKIRGNFKEIEKMIQKENQKELDRGGMDR